MRRRQETNLLGAAIVGDRPLQFPSALKPGPELVAPGEVPPFVVVALESGLGHTEVEALAIGVKLLGFWIGEADVVVGVRSHRHLI